MVSDITKTEVGLSYLHWRIHKGQLFYISDRATGSAAVEYHVKVGEYPLHIRWAVQAGLATPIDIIKGVTPSNDGTALASRNFDNTSTNTLTTTWYKAPTYTGGTTIKYEQAGNGTNSGNSSLGASGTGEEEIIFDANTSYIIKLAPSGTTTTVMFASMNEPDKWPIGG